MALPRRFTPAQDQEVAALYEGGLSAPTIGRRYGCSRDAVLNALRRTGTPRRKGQASRGRFGVAAARWDGGKPIITAQGYVRAYVPPGDPMRVMARNGRALEHRLVMARALGRQLLPTEQVHHINGDKRDNRIENLQLRTGNHGTGRVLRCAECGSHSIVSDELGG